MAAPAHAEDLLLNPEPALAWNAFDGPYVGLSAIYSTGDPGINPLLVIGQNFFFADNFYWGTELNAFKTTTTVGIKLGAAMDRFTGYGMVGAGFATNLPGGFVWRATAGVEYAVTDWLGLNAEISSTQTFGSLADAIDASVGLRFHHGNLTGIPHGQMSPDVLSNPAVQTAEAIGDFLGIQEVRLGPALSNLELKPDRMLLFFEPDFASFANARLDSMQFDVILRSPELFSWIGGARPQFGGVINLGGKESMASVGLNWQTRFGDSPFYAEVGVGLGIHNGYLSGAPPGYRDMGCRVLTHYEYSAGYDVNEKVSVTATWKHISGHLFGCVPNDGINTFGVTAGWKF